MAKHHPTSQEKSAALKHVYYEIAQLLSTSTRAFRGEASTWRTESRTVEYAFLESCLLHLRNLWYFFETEERRREGDRVLAVDYGFPARQVVGIDRSYLGRLNEDLAHLAYSRVRRVGWEWPLDKTVLPMLTLSSEFVEHLLGNYLARNDPDMVSKWECLLERLRDQSPSSWAEAVTSTTSNDGQIVSIQLDANE